MPSDNRKEYINQPKKTQKHDHFLPGGGGTCLNLSVEEVEAGNSLSQKQPWSTEFQDSEGDT